MLDLRVPHDRVGSSSDPDLTGHLRYPNNLDQSLNDTADTKLRKYRVDYKVSCPVLRVRLTVYIANLSEFYSYRLIGKLTAFLQLQELCLRNQIGFFHYRRSAFLL